ncbi:family 20 glycosylhydrolase [uncultured Varibaculum sp.]|uniref:family 20 glycosylhydrolase n=1 Tax=uncultured Varibaculum sp. TaxID=413896 RepID=UPI00258C07C9|nr:family 20 glycosylhydrolase [uncultured Varibaculum sp.]
MFNRSKKAFSLLGAGALALAALLPAGIGTAEAAEPTNHALAAKGGSVSASGNEVADKWQAAAAIDGNDSGDSRWSSNHSDQAWIAVHLKEAIKIDHITIKWEAACAASYHLEVSNDGTTWEKASGTIRPQCSSTDTQKLNAATANGTWKYVKMQAESRTPFQGIKYGVSLYEFEVWDGAEPVAPAQPNLIPLPAEMTPGEGGFELGTDTKIKADSASKTVAEMTAKTMRASTGFPLPVGKEGQISLRVDTSLNTTGLTSGNIEEAYSLKVSESGVEIVGKSAQGVWNATRTLLQLFPAFIYSPHQVNTQWLAPAITVKDAPRFAHRAIQADVARSFLTIADLKQMIDTFANVKGSRLHLHLSDDQGWRLQITNAGREAGDTIDYTKLTEVSGKTAMNWNSEAYSLKDLTGSSQQADDNVVELGHHGFYTQEEYKELVKYAADRFVTIQPEFDMPGHTNAALSAIPQLNSANSSHNGTVDAEGNAITDPAKWQVAPANGTGDVGYSYLDPDSKHTQYFVRHVFKQLAALTPGKIIHIGGDESHDMVKKLGKDKFNEFLNMSAKAVRDQGKSPIGWNEIASNTLQPGDLVQYWTGNTANTKRAIQNEGVKVAVSNASTAYIDMKYGVPGGNSIGLTWSGTGDFDKYYNWDPAQVIKGIPESSIVGTVAVQWSETIRGGYQAEWLMWPRSISHAEVAWTPQVKRNVNQFKQRMAAMGDRLTVSAVNFFDGSKANWQTALAGVDQKVAPNRSVNLTVGEFAAPGTVKNSEGTQITKAGNAASALGDTPFSATIDWGDGSAPSPAIFTQSHSRDALHSSPLYKVTGKHPYANPGTYTGTITGSNGHKTTFTVNVANGAPDPSENASWDGSKKPMITIEKNLIRPYERVKVKLSGFEPGKYVKLAWNDKDQFLAMPGADGSAEYYLPFFDKAEKVLRPQDTGTHQLRATQIGANRSAEVTATIVSDRQELLNPVAQCPTMNDPNCGYESISASSQADNEPKPSGPVSAAFDGNPNTYWHTRWAAPTGTFPHTVTAQLKAAPEQKCQITGFEYTARSGQENSRVKDFRIEVSENGNDWKSAISGSLKNHADPQVFNFAADKQLSGKYVRMVQLNSQAGNDFGGAAEIRFGALCAQNGTEVTPVAPVAEKQPLTEQGKEYPGYFLVPAVTGVNYYLGDELLTPQQAVPLPYGKTKIVARPASDLFRFKEGAKSEWTLDMGEDPGQVDPPQPEKPEKPAPKVVKGDWTDSPGQEASNCKTFKVMQTRSVTTTEYIWDAAGAKWVLDTANAQVTTEKGARDMSAAEKEKCALSPEEPSPDNPNPDKPGKPDVKPETKPGTGTDNGAVKPGNTESKPGTKPRQQNTTSAMPSTGASSELSLLLAALSIGFGGVLLLSRNRIRN